MIEIRAEFMDESAVIQSERGLIYYFSTASSLIKEEFTIILPNPNYYIRAFRSVFYPLLKKKINIPPDTIDYEFWREYELLRIAEEKYGTSSTRDDIDREDYSTIKNRRDDLLIRVRSQLNYLSDASKKIPKVRKRLEFLWLYCNTPLLTIIDGYFSLCTYTSSTYSELSLVTDMNDFFHGFVDFTPIFYESMDDTNAPNITLSNLRKSKSVSSPRLIHYEPATIENINIANTLLHIHRNSIVSKYMELSRIQTYDLLNLISQVKPDTILHLRIRAGSSYSMIKRDSNITITIKQGKKTALSFIFPAFLIQSVSEVLNKVEKIRFSDSLLGSVLNVYTTNFQLNQVYIPPDSKWHFHVLHNIIKEDEIMQSGLENAFQDMWVPTKKVIEHNKEILLMLLEGKKRFHFHGNLLHDTEFLGEISWMDTNRALSLRKIIRSIMVRSKTIYNVDIANHKVEIKVSNKIESQCSCGKMCDFLVALLAISLEEKKYER